MSERTFTNTTAVRESVPLLVGLMGPSGSGKTYSALRLATGMQRITGGEIFGIDTESRRMLHYADDFKFEHVPFGAPFSPLDYLAAIEYCAKKKASIIVVDSMTHEHEGPGGVLEWHDKEMKGDQSKQFIAWAKPKAARRRLINTVLQLGVNAVFCFRAKEKIKIQTGKDEKGKSKKPIQLGWMPIAGDEFLYEQTVNCLLYPASGGVPTWSSEEVGERQMMKLPKQFFDVFAEEQPLSEDIGQSLAQWAKGDVKAPSDEESAHVVAEVLAAESTDALDVVRAAHRAATWTAKQRGEIGAAVTRRRAELANGGSEPEADPGPCMKPIGDGECYLDAGHEDECQNPNEETQ